MKGLITITSVLIVISFSIIGSPLTSVLAQSAPSATTSAASGVSSSGATLNGIVNANGSSTTVIFQYGTDTSYGTTVTADQSPVTGSTNTTVSKTILGLTPNTLYHYRVTATNAYGTSYGADMTFMTIIGDDHGNNPATSTNINIGDTVAGDIEIDGDVDFFRFNAIAGVTYIIETSLGSLSDSVIHLYDRNGVSELEYDDDGGEGLASRIEWTAFQSGVYYVKVRGFNSSQTGTYTLTVNGTGTPAAVTEAATIVDSSTATLNGIVNANGSSTTVIFQYGTDTSYGTTVTADQSPVTGSTNTTVSKTILGLTPNTLYHYRVTATNAYGTSYGADMTFTTEPRKPSKPANGKAHGKDDAPGQNKEPGEPADGKDHAPGQNKEPGEPANGKAHGKDYAPGQNK